MDTAYNDAILMTIWWSEPVAVFFYEHNSLPSPLFYRPHDGLER